MCNWCLASISLTRTLLSCIHQSRRHVKPSFCRPKLYAPLRALADYRNSYHAVCSKAPPSWWCTCCQKQHIKAKVHDDLSALLAITGLCPRQQTYPCLGWGIASLVIKWDGGQGESCIPLALECHLGKILFKGTLDWVCCFLVALCTNYSILLAVQKFSNYPSPNQMWICNIHSFDGVSWALNHTKKW